MQFDLERRTISLSVGELSDFTLGPRGSGGGMAGLWRAQLGTRWHRQLREQTAAVESGAAFEVPIEGEILHRGWIVSLSGRIDQIGQTDAGPVLREIKTVARAVPAPESELRSEYPSYFAQLAAYAALFQDRDLAKTDPPGLSPSAAVSPDAPARCELVFVEPDTGLAQTVVLTDADRRLLFERLDRVAEFLDLRLRARDRLRGFRFRRAFADLRPGQETVETDLRDAVRSGEAAVLLEAPTGFGKTGVLLQLALGELREGNFERVLYLTGKSTGQIQVAATLASMTAPGPDLGSGAPVAAWLVRNKAEHCVNSVFRCVSEVCRFIDGVEERWPSSGLARFYLIDGQPRDLPSLRAAGEDARICPYEITRAALAFNDVWIGDYNYVFAPDNRGLFYDRPGFDPGRTLLVVDEAHNLPSRAADAHSHALSAVETRDVADALRQIRNAVRLATAWDELGAFVGGLGERQPLTPQQEEDARDRLMRVAEAVSLTPVDPTVFDARQAEIYWRVPSIAARLAEVGLPRLWWSPRAGELAIACLDAAPAIGAALREFGGVILATATPGPVETFAEACGLPGLTAVRAATPWRDGAYDVAVDLRVDTAFQHRVRHFGTTAATVAALAASQRGDSPAGDPGAVAVFFPSYAYADAIAREVSVAHPELVVAVQPRRRELSAQAAWMEEALDGAGTLFLVLGSGFTESIDLLGGRVTRAMVVGPSLPEVNPIQHAKMASYLEKGRDAAFDRAYRIPGMQKVNQALGRLVRAPGQRARVLLHCRRFAEPGYARLLAPEYRNGRRLIEDEDLNAWLAN